MNLHKFQLDIKTGRCAICNLGNVVNHDECRSCKATGPVTIVDGILACELCAKRDEEIKMEVGDIENLNGRNKRMAEILNLVSLEVMSKPFFVAESTAIADLEEKLKNEDGLNPDDSSFYEEAILVLTEKIKQMRKANVDIKNACIADQRYINEMMPKCRQEFREQFKQYDVTYKPREVIAPIRVKKARMSLTERSYASGAKHWNLTPEQYERILNSSISAVTGNRCMCAETPGLCPIHNPRGASKNKAN